ncbi:MAG TPA: FMN-dependent NADH-azoreductase, partial [Desulfobacteria bacterium]|nr:FMN-dependent NADH-azoreductase [Desulfobacteria bacterium]
WHPRGVVIVANVLYITANPKASEKSVSLSLGQEFLREYKEARPKDEITVLDLYKSDIPEIDYELMDAMGSLMAGLSPASLPEQARKKLERYNQFTDQFVNADKYVFVTPMWNLGMPPRVKTYLDTVCVAGKTFKYTEKGPEGLLQNKKCLHIHASGGFHSQDNHADAYLRDLMRFLGVEDYRSLVVEGHNALPDKAKSIINEVRAKIPVTVGWFA